MAISSYKRRFPSSLLRRLVSPPRRFSRFTSRSVSRVDKAIAADFIPSGQLLGNALVNYETIRPVKKRILTHFVTNMYVLLLSYERFSWIGD